MTTIPSTRRRSHQFNQTNLINQDGTLEETRMDKVDYFKNKNSRRSFGNPKFFGSTGKGSSFSDIIASIEDNTSVAKSRKNGDRQESLKKKKSNNRFLIDDNQLKSKSVFKRRFDKAATRIQTTYRVTIAKRRHQKLKLNIRHGKHVIIIQKTFRMYYQCKKYNNLKFNDKFRIQQQQQQQEERDQQLQEDEDEDEDEEKQQRQQQKQKQQKQRSTIHITTTATAVTTAEKEVDAVPVVLDNDEKLQIELANIQKRKQKKINNMINREQKKFYQVNKVKDLQKIIGQLKEEKFALESNISDTQHQINILNRSNRTISTRRESIQSSKGNYSKIMEMVKDDENKKVEKKIDAQNEQIALVEKDMKKVNKKIKRKSKEKEKYADSINAIVAIIEDKYDTGISITKVGSGTNSKVKEDMLLSKLVTKIHDVMINY